MKVKSKSIKENWTFTCETGDSHGRACEDYYPLGFGAV